MIEHEGRYSRDRTPVTGGVYSIPERLKEIDEHLFVMFNRRTQKYEVHDSQQLGATLACELPYDALDARALSYVRERYGQNIFALMARIDRENDENEQRQYDEVIDRAQYKTKEALRYLDMNTHTDDIPKELIEE